MTPLSVAEVADLLESLDVDQDALVLMQRNPTTVVVTGPRPARRAAFDALFELGLRVGPYPESDHYCR